MENPIKMDDLGVPLFLETPIYPPYSIPFMVYYNSVVFHLIFFTPNNPFGPLFSLLNLRPPPKKKRGKIKVPKLDLTAKAQRSQSPKQDIRCGMCPGHAYRVGTESSRR